MKCFKILFSSVQSGCPVKQCNLQRFFLTKILSNIFCCCIFSNWTEWIAMEKCGFYFIICWTFFVFFFLSCNDATTVCMCQTKLLTFRQLNSFHKWFCLSNTGSHNGSTKLLPCTLFIVSGKSFSNFYHLLFLLHNFQIASLFLPISVYIGEGGKKLF